MSSAVDHLLHQVKHKGDTELQQEYLGRFLCTKSSWRGKYRRILGITATAVVTLYPDTLAVTNSWDFVNDFDLESAAVGASDAEEPEFILTARGDKKVQPKHRPAACAHQ